MILVKEQIAVPYTVSEKKKHISKTIKESRIYTWTYSSWKFGKSDDFLLFTISNCHNIQATEKSKRAAVFFT